MREVLGIMLALVHTAVATGVMSAYTKEIMLVIGTSVVITDILVEIRNTSVVFGVTLGIMLVLVYMVVATRVISADTREIMLVTGTLVEIKNTSVVIEVATVALVDIILGITTIIIVMAIQLHPATLIAPIHPIDPGTIRPVPTRPIRQAILLLPPTLV